MKTKLLSLMAFLGMSAIAQAQVTFTAVEGSDWDNNEGSAKAFDGDRGTKWCKNGDDDETKCYVIVEASEATYLQGMTFTTANDNEQYTNRTPKEYTLYGSNDYVKGSVAGTWTQIYYQKDDNFIGDKNYTDYTIYCNTNTQYKYYKLWIKDSNINGGRLFQISELTLIPSKVGFTLEEGNSRAFDGNTDAKWEGGGLPMSVTVKATEPAYLTGYQFTTGNDNQSWTGRNPKDYTIEGSNDAKEWTVLVNVTENTDMPDINYYPCAFNLPGTPDEKYQYYRITVTATQGGGYFQLGEVALMTSLEGHVHNYVDGVCSCGDVDPETAVTLTDGWYEPAALSDFVLLKSIMVQHGKMDMKIRLTHDIDMSDDTQLFNGFCAGKDVAPFTGEFDGQGHWLKNLTISSRGDNAALFGNAEGAYIHDLGFESPDVRITIGKANAGVVVGNAKNTRVERVAVMKGGKDCRVEGHDHVGAILGNSVGSTVVKDCISDMQVYSRTYQAGGLIGTCNGLDMESCIFLGNVKNDNNNASALVSLIDAVDNPTTIKNCVAAATELLAGNTGLYPVVNTAGRAATFENNRIAASMIFRSTQESASESLKAGETRTYDDINGSDGLTTPDKDMKVKSFYANTMGWDMENTWKFVAAGHYPVLKWMDAEVPTQTVTVGETGYATFVADEYLDFSGQTEIKAYAAQVMDGYVHLEPVTGVSAGEAVVVRAVAANNYVIAACPEEYPAENSCNELLPSDGSVAGGSAVFVLANGASGVGFYPTTDGSSVAAGKGYLNISGAAEARFIGFEFDDETGIANVEVAGDAATPVYNLAGQRLSKAQKGINIIGGKKVLY